VHEAGAKTVRDFQAVQLAAFVRARRTPGETALIAGDLNEAPGGFVYRQLTGLGLRDAQRAAGGRECDSARNLGCTAGREDHRLAAFESRVNGETERIDYLLIGPPSARVCQLDGPDDGDGDGIGTRLFAGAPNPFEPACGPAPLPVCWPSDHTGVELDLNCEPQGEPPVLTPAT
jgi:hypothetical protein